MDLIVPGCSIKVSKKQLIEVAKLSICYALMPILLYSSYNCIDSGTATTLHFTYPIAVMLIMSVFCKVRMEAKQIVCAVSCVAGLALLYTPGGQANILGIALAVISGVVVFNEMLSMKESIGIACILAAATLLVIPFGINKNRKREGASSNDRS